MQNVRIICVLWKAIEEITINGRVSYVDIYDEDNNVIFGYGDHYTMYVIKGAVLVYDNQWIPYLFGSNEEDPMCIWKYFCVSRDGIVRYNDA